MATVTARVDENVKKEAETLFKKMGQITVIKSI